MGNVAQRLGRPREVVPILTRSFTRETRRASRDDVAKRAPSGASAGSLDGAEYLTDGGAHRHRPVLASRCPHRFECPSGDTIDHLASAAAALTW